MKIFNLKKKACILGGSGLSQEILNILTEWCLGEILDINLIIQTIYSNL